MRDVGKPEITYGGMTNTFTWEELSLRVVVDKITDDGKSELFFYYANGTGEERLLHMGAANLLSSTMPNSFIKPLATRGLDIDWQTVLTYITHSTMQRLRQGEELVYLNEDFGKVAPEYLLYPLFIDNAPNIIYADRSSAKTLFIIMLCLMLNLPLTDNELGLIVPDKHRNILFLDWEGNAQMVGWQKERLREGLGIGWCDLAYLHCSRSLVDSVHFISKKITEVNASVIVIDSLGMAVGDDLNLTKPAFAFFSALRQLPVTPLIIAHTSKDVLAKRKTVYGNAYYENEARCYSSDTEVLTKSGWKLHKNITLEDEVCCYEVTRNGQTFRWDKPTKLWEYEYNGDMILINHKGVGALITPKHRVLTNNHGVIEAETLLHYQKDSYKIPYSAILRKRGSHNGRQKELLQLLKGHKHVKLDAFLRFLGYWISEGGMSGHTKSNIILTQNEGIVLDNMKLALDELGFVYTDNKRQSTPSHTLIVRFDASEKYLSKNGNPRPGRGKGRQRLLASWLSSNCGDKIDNKYLPNFIWGLSVKKMKVLLDALIEGDGHQYEAGHACYTTTSKRLADDIQRLAMLVGLTAKLTSRKRVIGKTQFELLLSKPNRLTRTITRKQCQRVNYSGKVYCLSVPTGFYVTRRNGTIAILGNSVWECSKKQEPGSSELTLTIHHRKPPPFAPIHEPLAYRFMFGNNITVEQVEPIIEGKGESLSGYDIVLAIISESSTPIKPGDIQRLTNPAISMNGIYQACYQLKKRGEVQFIDGGYCVNSKE